MFRQELRAEFITGWRCLGQIMPDLNQTQEEILTALADLDGEAPKADIADRIRPMSKSNVRKQSKSLVELGLLEIVGSRDAGAPNKENIYGLTADGRDVVEVLNSDTRSGGVSINLGADAARVADLEMAVANHGERLCEVEQNREQEQERDRDAMAARIDELENEIATLQESIDDHRRKLDRVAEELWPEATSE